ncbi:DMT family transporter [Sulfurospirillum sp. 1307]|jgi:drug/metabolite transporter (DMT)-like permease
MSLGNYSLLFLLSILWGGSFFFIEKALLFFSYEQLVFFRVFFAAIFILLVLLIKKIQIAFDIKLWYSFLVIGCLNNVIPFLAITYAQESISASLASLFNATTPIFTAILAHFFTKDEKATTLKSIGILIGFIGIIVLLLPTSFGSFQIAGLFAIAGALSYAFAGIFGKKLANNNPIFNVFGMLSSSSFILYVVFFSSINQVSYDNFWKFKDVLLLAIFSTSLAYIIYFKLLASIGAVKLLLVTYLIPITASFLGVFFLNEVFTLNMLFGALLIFVSLYFINKEKA